MPDTTPPADPFPPTQITLTLGSLGPALLRRALSNYENQIQMTLANPRSRANPEKLELELEAIASVRSSLDSQEPQEPHNPNPNSNPTD